MMSLEGIIKIKLLPSGDATRDAVNISYVDNFQNLVTPIIFTI